MAKAAMVPIAIPAMAPPEREELADEDETGRPEEPMHHVY